MADEMPALGRTYEPLDGGTYPRTRHVIAHAREGHANMVLIGLMGAIFIVGVIVIVIAAVNTRPTNRAMVTGGKDPIAVTSRGTTGAVSATVDAHPDQMWVSSVDVPLTKGAMPPLAAIQGQGYQTQAYTTLTTGNHELFVALMDGDNVGDTLAHWPFQLWNVHGSWIDSGSGFHILFQDNNDGAGTLVQTSCTTGATVFGQRGGATIGMQDEASAVVHAGDTMTYTEADGTIHTLARTSTSLTC